MKTYNSLRRNISTADYHYQQYNSMEQNLSREASSHSATQKTSSFYEAPRFITVFTTVRHWSTTWAVWIWSTPTHPIYLRSILLISFPLHLGHPSRLLPLGLLTKILYEFITPHACYMPAHLSEIDWREKYIENIRFVNCVYPRFFRREQLHKFIVHIICNHPIFKYTSLPYHKLYDRQTEHTVPLNFLMKYHQFQLLACWMNILTQS
jgi:hypothetical protein